jgi:hypothetical protein
VSEQDAPVRRVLLREVPATAPDRPLDDRDLSVRDRLAAVVDELDDADADMRTTADLATAAWLLAS